MSFRHDFGERFIKANKYTAKVVFRNGKIYPHLSLPFELFQYRVACDKLIASLDLNSDRINMVIVDWNRRIRDIKVKYFPEVSYPALKGVELLPFHPPSQQGFIRGLRACPLKPHPAPLVKEQAKQTISFPLRDVIGNISSSCGNSKYLKLPTTPSLPPCVSQP